MFPRSMFESEAEYTRAIRDHFAAAALPQAMSRAHYFRTELGPKEVPNTDEFAATMAYRIADAMLKERAK